MTRRTTAARRTSPIFTFAAALRGMMMEELRVHREMEYAAAVEATNGALLRNWSVPSWDVFTGNQQLLNKYASEELQEYLRNHPRKSRQEFEAEWLALYLEVGHGPEN